MVIWHGHFWHWHCFAAKLKKLTLGATNQNHNTMEDQKHTPLPWEQYAGPFIVTFRDSEQGGFALFYGPDREANANLFMQAPELQAEIERDALQIKDVKSKNAEGVDRINELEKALALLYPKAHKANLTTEDFVFVSEAFRKAAQPFPVRL